MPLLLSIYYSHDFTHKPRSCADKVEVGISPNQYLFWLAAGENHIGEMIPSDMATDSHNYSLALGDMAGD